MSKRHTPPKRSYRMAARAEAAAATKQRIHAAAWRQFSEHPYEDVRLADIAADAEVTVQTLHTAVGTKDDLFVAAWRWMATDVVTQRDAAPAGDVKTAVRLLYDTYEAGSDAALRLLAQEERIPAVRKMADAGRAYHRDWVARTFAPQLDKFSGATRQRRHVELIVATDVLVWKLLRREMRLTRAEAERVVTDMITAVVKGTS
jgi:AcrR family transcriptional regulator